MNYFAQIILAINHLHTNNIIHRDIKPSNTLIDSINGFQIVKMADFGISKAHVSGQTGKTTSLLRGCKTTAYTSPEVLDEDEQSVKSDIWACGIILYQLFVNKNPFEPKNGKEPAMINNIINKTFEIPDKLDDEIKNLFLWLLDKNPERRPTTQELLESPALKPYVLKFISNLKQVDRNGAETIFISIQKQIPFFFMP